jgi:solute carrier family 25 S-adenosylmethionine transporter 26
MIASSVTLVPADVVKTRLQASPTGRTVVSTVRSIIREKGYRGLYVGYYATLVRDVPYTMLELGIYENLKNVMLRSKVNKTGIKQLSFSDELLAAAITGGIASFVTTPLDLVKTKLMMEVSSLYRKSVIMFFHHLNREASTQACLLL